jgi:hypothetical protein
VTEVLLLMINALWDGIPCSLANVLGPLDERAAAMFRVEGSPKEVVLRGGGQWGWGLGLNQ